MSDKFETKRLTDRRSFLRMTATGLLAIPAAALLRPERADAQDMPKLSMDDPQAKALGYHHDYTNVDPEKFPARKAGELQHCANCQLYTGSPDAEWGGCSIFPGKLVAADGWCKTWVKKAG